MSKIIFNDILVQYGQVDGNGNVFIEGCFDKSLREMNETTLIITKDNCLEPDKIQTVEDFIDCKTKLDKEQLRTFSLILGYHNNQFIVIKNRGTSIKINDQVFKGGIGAILNLESLR